jgi:hypothetical protein
MAKKMQMIAVIGMMAAMVFGFNSCTKEFNLEAPEQSTSWGQPKKLENQKITVWEELSEKFSFFAKFEKGGNTLYETSYERPFGAYGEATKVVTVESESDLSGVKYVEGKLNTEKTDWESGYWFGTQVTRSQNFRLANAKYGADFSDTWFSTNAFFQKDTLRAEFADAEWSREVRLDSTDVYNKSIDGQKGYYKVRDFIATVDNTAKVNKDFVKDAAKATKTFTVKDTLSLRFYVEPDPEDEFIRRWMVVELSEENQTIKGAFVTREEWSLSGIIEVDRKPFVRTATAQGQNYGYVLASTDDYKTTGTKVEGTGNMTFNASASNGHEGEGFVSAFSLYGDESITYSYKDCSETVTCKLVCDDVQQNITAKGPQTINGVYYNVSDYVASIAPVYTATWKNETASINLSATSTREIRVKVDEVFENTRQVKTVTEKENGFDVKVDFYMKSNLKAEYLAKTLDDEFVFSYAGREHDDLIAESASDFATTSNGVSGNTYRNTLSNKKESTQNIYDWTLNKKETTLSYNGASVTVKCDISFEELEGKVAETAHTTKVVNNVTYDAYAYNNSTRATLACEGKKVTKDASTAYDVLVKHDDTVETKVENQDYSFTANVNGNTLVGTGLNTVKKAEYVNGVKKDGSEQTFTQEKIITATLTVTPTFGVADKAGLNASFTWGSFGETANEPEQTVTENNKTYKVNVRNFRGYVAGKPAYVRLEEKTQVVTIDGVTLATTSVDAVKAVDMVASAVAGNNVTLTPQVNVTLSTDDGVATKAAVGNPTTYTIESSMVGTYTPETVREYEPKVENGQAVVYVYDVTDGVKTQVRRDPFTPSATLKAQAGTDVYAANNAFNTVYNGERNSSTSSSSSSYWTVSNKKGQITSTMSNGAKSETNVADFGFDQAITYKDGNYTYTFNGSMVMSNSTDAITAAGNKTVNGIAYEASNYQENFYGVYSIDGTVVANLSDAVKRQILVEVEIEDLVPGTILAVNVRAVAAVWNGSKYVNADGHLDKIKGLAIVTKEHKGAYIPFAAASADVALPTDEEIKNANYVEKDYYNSDYVAGYDTNKNGNWQLALVDDRTNQIVYFDGGRTIEESTAVRSLTQKSMNTWDWTSAEQTSQVGGYKIEVKDGICKVYFNDKLVKIFK